MRGLGFRRLVLPFVCAVPIIFAGCGGGVPGLQPAQPAQPANPSSVPAVSGTYIDTCVSDSGQTTTHNQGLTPNVIQALVPNSNGGFDTYNGVTPNDGTFSIPNVPSGPYWLTVAGSRLTKLWTASRNVSLGSTYWGHCDDEAEPSPGTSLTISASGMDPWQYDDYFYFAVPNARVSNGTLPADGATSLSFTIPYDNLSSLSSANGDMAYFAQLVPTTYAGISFPVLQNFSGPLPITLNGGVSNSISVALQPVPQTHTFRANIRGSAFAALYSSMSPGATPANPGDNLRLVVTPNVPNVAPDSNGIFLMLASQAFPVDTDAGDVAYGNPYSPAWETFLDYSDISTKNVTPPGATSPFLEVFLNRVLTTDMPTASNPVTPLIGPAINPQINGTSLFSDQTISGTTPALSWQPPVVGTASGYLLGVYQWQVNGGVANLDLIASLYTDSSPIILPPGLLSSGHSYFIEIQSLYRKNIDIGVSPNLETFPEGSADLGSGIITVQ